MRFNQSFGLIFVLLLISMMITSCVTIDQKNQTRNIKSFHDSINQVGFFSVFINKQEDYNNLIEIEAMVMNKEKAIEKEELYQKIQQKKEILYRDFPRSNNNLAEIEAYELKKKKEIIFVQKLLVKFFEIRGPLVSFYVSPDDLGGLVENQAFEMIYVPCEKIESGPLSVERFFFYRIKVL